MIKTHYSQADIANLERGDASVAASLSGLHDVFCVCLSGSPNFILPRWIWVLSVSS